MARHGGTFGAMKVEGARKAIEAIYGKDVRIDGDTDRGYTVTDTYRPEMVFTGKTPKAALAAAGFIVWTQG